MFHAAKLLWTLLVGIVFQNKEEYDFKSDKFNARKFIVSLMLLMSIVLNILFVYRLYVVGNDYIALHQEASKLCPAAISQITSAVSKKP